MWFKAKLFVFNLAFGLCDFKLKKYKKKYKKLQKTLVLNQGTKHTLKQQDTFTNLPSCPLPRAWHMVFPSNNLTEGLSVLLLKKSRTIFITFEKIRTKVLQVL